MADEVRAVLTDEQMADRLFYAIEAQHKCGPMGNDNLTAALNDYHRWNAAWAKRAPAETDEVRAAERLQRVVIECDGLKGPERNGKLMDIYECERVDDAQLELAFDEQVLSRAYLAARADTGGERPTVVCLCGSTRFYEAFQRANYEETMAGRIVLSVGHYPNSDGKHGELVGCTPEQKVALDVLHKRKIDIADEVLILNVGGYVGDSTRGELNYAIKTGKRVRWLEPDAALAPAATQPTPAAEAAPDRELHEPTIAERSRTFVGKRYSSVAEMVRDLAENKEDGEQMAQELEKHDYCNALIGDLTARLAAAEASLGEAKKQLEYWNTQCLKAWQDRDFAAESAKGLQAELTRRRAVPADVLQAADAILNTASCDIDAHYPKVLARFIRTLAAGEGNDWVCEQHPDLSWPHGDCAGPGMPREAAEHE